MHCSDCGPVAVPHWVERWSVRMDVLIDRLAKPFDLILRGAKPVLAPFRLGRMAPPLVRCLRAARLGTIVVKPDEKTNWRARVLWEEAERRGIVMKEFRPFGLAREFFFATYKDDTIAFDGLPRPRAAHNASLNWMDDKGIIIKRFSEAGIPVPRGKTCTTYARAEETFVSIGGPIVVKPNLGSRSRHTYLHITDIATLRRAFLKAKELSPWVVIEEELPGSVFRVTLVGRKIAGIMRREPPSVTGDGRRTVRELVREENKNPLRRGPIFHMVELGEESRAMLKEQNLSLASVPPKGAAVVLHPKVSRACGASTTEIVNAHPENKKLFVKIAEVLNDPLVGVDLMMEDMARPWHNQKCGVIECNSLPFIDLHHYPFRGPARNVAAAVWDLIFPAEI